MPARTNDLKRLEGSQSEKLVAKRAIKDPRLRLARVIEILESQYGLPVWEGPRDGLEVLILTILSQNTTDPNALRGYIKLCETFPRSELTSAIKDESALPRNADGSIDAVAIRLSQVADAFFSPDWAKVAAANVSQVKEAIRAAGLPNAKGPAIHAVLHWLFERSGGYRLEDALEGLSEDEAISLMSSLPGVGLKTATVTLIEAWGSDLCPVDTHVHRLAHRLEVVEATSDRNKTYERLRKAHPKGKGFSLHHNLLTLGRTICTAKSPKCGDCFLAKLCPSAGNG